MLAPGWKQGEYGAVQAITDLIMRHPARQAAALTAFRAKVQHLVPGAGERIFYGMPSFDVGGVVLLSYEGFSDHNSVFPGPDTIAELSEELAGYRTTKATIHFEREALPPRALITLIVRTRIRLINQSYPKRGGQFRAYYDNGFLKAKGRYVDGDMHGDWEFYRRDGSLMRSGRLRHGRPVGKWTTYPRAVSA